MDTVKLFEEDTSTTQASAAQMRRSDPARGITADELIARLDVRLRTLFQNA